MFFNVQLNMEEYILRLTVIYDMRFLCLHVALHMFKLVINGIIFIYYFPFFLCVSLSNQIKLIK